jgi:hypothetical protein
LPAFYARKLAVGSVVFLWTLELPVDLKSRRHSASNARPLDLR